MMKNIIERNKNKFDEYEAIDEFGVNKFEALYYLLDIPDGKPQDIQRAIAQKGENQKLPTTTKKKRKKYN